MKIEGDVSLLGNCSFKGRAVIEKSNTHLNCNGSEFSPAADENVGLYIDSKGKELRNISVKNCKFIGYKSNGIRIAWSGSDVGKSGKVEELYYKTPRDIVIDNVEVRRSGRVGIFFDDYVSNVVLSNSVIERSQGAGIYLEHGSKNISIISNKITLNGLERNREGLAIDSSASNIINGNTFYSNKIGGIFLYKNCGEHFSSGKQVLRWQHSNENIIKNNTFINEKVGIHLASRQKKDLRKMGCGDPMINERGWYADYADFNSVVDNKFCRTKVPVKDNGRGNKIARNVVAC